MELPMRWTFALTLTILLATIPSTQGQVIAASDELHQLVANKRYPEALQRITAGLALKGPAAKSVDRCDLFMLKGECHLQMRATSMAIDAFNNAAREAELLSDDHRHSIAAAHAALLKASKAFAYTPKTAPDKTRPVPIDILDQASRRQAFLAMLVDELAANDAKLKAAKAAKSLPPFAQVFKPLNEMEGLELAAKEGSTTAEKIGSLRKELAESAKKMLADALRNMSKRIGDIDKEAGTFTVFYQDTTDPLSPVPRILREKVYRKKGLTDAATKELQETTQTCDKLGLALSELASGLKVDDNTFEPFSDEASRIRKEVERILDTDYLKIYRELPKK
jgi:hypothetical protein